MLILQSGKGSLFQGHPECQQHGGIAAAANTELTTQNSPYYLSATFDQNHLHRAATELSSHKTTDLSMELSLPETEEVPQLFQEKNTDFAGIIFKI